MIKVGVIDDHQVLNHAIEMVIRAEADMVYVGSARNYAEGLQLILDHPMNVLLLDVHLPDGDGMDLLPVVKEYRPETQVVVLASRADENTMLRAIENGACGFLTKDKPLADLLHTIRKAAEGEIVMPGSLMVGLLTRYRNASLVRYPILTKGESLTERELEVLRCLGAGKSGAAIAKELSISPFTVRTHIRNIMAKLGVHSRLEAVTYSLRSGLIQSV